MCEYTYAYVCIYFMYTYMCNQYFCSLRQLLSLKLFLIFFSFQILSAKIPYMALGNESFPSLENLPLQRKAGSQCYRV